MPTMPMPRPDEPTKERFRAMLPPDPRVQMRPMFGQLAGFVNGHMFTGLYGNDLFVRLPEEERTALLREEGATLFEPMLGRPMREYVVLPAAWQAEPERMQPWVERSLAFAAALPAKEAKPRSPKKKR